MKKLILIFGVFAIVCVIISSLLNESVQNSNAASVKIEQRLSKSQGYTVKSINGKIAVYAGDTLCYKTNTSVSTLPKKDQRTLLYGIHVDTKEEAEKILQDYCS